MDMRLFQIPKFIGQLKANLLAEGSVIEVWISTPII